MADADGLTQAVRDLKTYRRAKRKLTPAVLKAASLGMKAHQIAQHSGLTAPGVYGILRREAARTAPVRPDAATGGTPTDTEETAR